jgi:hypothetical protein
MKYRREGSLPNPTVASTFLADVYDKNLSRFFLLSLLRFVNGLMDGLRVVADLRERKVWNNCQVREHIVTRGTRSTDVGMR